MEIDPKFFPIIVGVIGVAGIAFGSLLTEFRDLLENRRNNKRVLKQALYHQFELFSEMLVFDKDSIDEFFQSFGESLSEKGIPAKAATGLIDKIPNQIIEIFKNTKAESGKELFERHESTILKLSEIDPLFATNWSYSSRSKLPEQMKDIFNQVRNLELDKTENGEKFLVHIQQWIENKARKRLLNSIEKGIVEIAWKIDLRTWWKTRQKIKNWRQTAKQDIKKEINEYISEIARFAQENK